MIRKINIKTVNKILGARRTGVLLEGLDDDEQPSTLHEAYSFQEALTDQWGDQVAGWKVGATSQEIQRLFGISEPVYGPVFKKCVFNTPARVAVHSFHHRMLETEFAFRFPRGLPIRSKRYSLYEIIEAADALIPALEIISPRFKTLSVANVPLLVTDFCASGGAVLGTPYLGWRALDLSSSSASFQVDGAERQRGTGSVAFGNPLNVLEWFVSALAQRGKNIGPGQFVMTGTITGLHAIESGQTARSDFGALGTVEVTFIE
jgi:2-keto-4-pentenoate hydratase